jgi:hypothetical protein
VRLKYRDQRWQISAPATSFWATEALDRRAPALDRREPALDLRPPPGKRHIVPRHAHPGRRHRTPHPRSRAAGHGARASTSRPGHGRRASGHGAPPLVCLKGEEEQRDPHGASAPDAPRGRAAARRQPEQDDANQGNLHAPQSSGMSISSPYAFSL